MLTCKIDGIKVNVFDTPESLLRDHSKKGSLCCGGCGERIVYNHGEIKDTIYLRHYRKETCSSEQETEEHEKGKLQLYEALKKNKNFKNVNLEHYIPETRQVADISLEYENEKIVIEFQCSRISTQLKQRNRKYLANGYKVFWIFGFDNYGIKKAYKFSKKFYMSYKMTASEMTVAFEYNYQPIYLDVRSNQITQIKHDGIVIEEYPKKTMYDIEYTSSSLLDFNFESLFKKEIYDDYLKIIELYLKPDVTTKNNYLQEENSVLLDMYGTKYRFLFISKYVNEDDIEKIKDKGISSQEVIIPILNASTHNLKPNIEYRVYKLATSFFFDPERKNILYMKHLRSERQDSFWSSYDMDYYSPTICEHDELWITGDEITTPLSAYVALKDKIQSTELSLLFNDNYRAKLRQINELLFQQKYIYSKAQNEFEKEQVLTQKQKVIEQFKLKMGNNLNKKIIIHDGYYRLPNEVRFKLLKHVDEKTIVEHDFIVNEFGKTVNHLFNITQQEYIVLMLPRLKSLNQRRGIRKWEEDQIQNTLTQYGFKNISITKGKFTIDQ